MFERKILFINQCRYSSPALDRPNVWQSKADVQSINSKNKYKINSKSKKTYPFTPKLHHWTKTHNSWKTKTFSLSSTFSEEKEERKRKSNSPLPRRTNIDTRTKNYTFFLTMLFKKTVLCKELKNSANPLLVQDKESSWPTIRPDIIAENAM